MKFKYFFENFKEEYIIKRDKALVFLRIPEKLPSSDELLIHDIGDVEEGTLVSLLQEAWERGLNNRPKKKIICTARTLDKKRPSDVIDPEPYLVYYPVLLSYSRLDKIYAQRGESFSPELAEERHRWKMEIYEKEAERRGAWGAYIGAMSYIKAVQKENKREKDKKNAYKKGGKKAVEELNNEFEKEDRGHMLIIG